MPRPSSRRSTPAILTGLLSVLLTTAPTTSAADHPLSVGVAKVDVTPDFPVRLSGYVARKSESDGTAQHLFARAVAIGHTADDACLLVTLDNTAVPASLTESVAAALNDKAHVSRERFVLSCTHTHCAPCLSGAIVNILGRPFTAEENAHVERYTQLVAKGIEQAALSALKDLRPSTLAFGQGEVGFAANRRTKGGPVDHSLPLLVARDAATNKLRAILVDYACHCTTIGPDVNQTSADWAGFATEAIEQQQRDGADPSPLTLVTIGCGADANPSPRGSVDLARQHGNTIAAEVDRLLKSNTVRPITASPAGKLQRIPLAFDKTPTREEWQKLAQRTDAIGSNAKLQLAKLDRGEQPDADLPYLAQSWTFGDQLAMVFLAGEVVVDYDLRLKQDFDPTRLWISAYSNDVPCYIPSQRILKEGGYEAEGAMTYYGRPGRLAPAVEDDIIRAVHAVLPLSYRTPKSLDEFPPAKSVGDSLQSFKLADDNLEIEPAVTEPLIASPVCIDWDARGRLWVVEMYDYPSGLHDDWRPGGRIKLLESSHHDGAYDKATVVLDHLRFPQGVMAWRDGAIVCAAPDVLFVHPKPAGDGYESRVLFSGFSPDNQQWEVNAPVWGLDGWIYAASSIHNEPIRIGDTGKTVDLGGRDFRMNPDTLAFEPAAGRTQYCRVRDDFGRWFGNDNSNPLWQYPLPERYVARNPYVTPPRPSVTVPADADLTRVYPISRLLERFNSPQSANRVTSGCGTGVYRDALLGEAFTDNPFFCEPVHNVVRRYTVEPSGSVPLRAHRAPPDRDAEFLASTDNWFRPVQVRTGPDGALWVVDMHRFLVEHPRWISADRMARIDARAGADTGRLWRIKPKGAALRPVEDLTRLSTVDLAKRLDTDNGTVRDLAHAELLHRPDASTATATLREIARTSTRPAARLQALCALEGSGALEPTDVVRGLADSVAEVRAEVVRFAEPLLSKEITVAEAVLKLARDPDPAVRFQVALSLGEWTDPRATAALADIATAGLEDPWLRAAVANASIRRPIELLDALATALPNAPSRGELLGQIAVVCAHTTDAAGASKAVLATLPDAAQKPVELWQYHTAAALLDALASRSLALDKSASDRLAAVTASARTTAADASAPAASRVAALRLLGRGDKLDPPELQTLRTLLRPQVAPSLHTAAIDAAARSADPAVAALLIDAWPTAAPSARARLLQVLASRPAWASSLLDAIAAGNLPASQIPADARDRLLKHDADAVRQRAAAVFASAATGTRADVVKQFAPALKLTGDVARGRALFEKNCTACHQLQGVGHAVGPNLAALTDRSSQYLLTSILDPNAAVEGRYVAYRVRTTDGRDLTGLVVDETAAGFTVLGATDTRDAVKRAQIKSLTSTGLSLMPEGFESGLSPQDLADLILFLQKT